MQVPSKHSPAALAFAKITFSLAVIALSKPLHILVMLSVPVFSIKRKILRTVNF